MSFGLRNAAQTFQCLIDKVQYGLLFIVYTGNILVASANIDEHKQHLHKVFQIFSFWAPDKFRQIHSRINFLGNNINTASTSSLTEIKICNHQFMKLS